MRVILDGSVCFDSFGACFDYYTQLTPRLIERGCEVVLTPSPTGVLKVLDASGAKVTRSFFKAPSWLPNSAMRRWLSRLKKRLEDRRLPEVTAEQPVLYQSFYYSLRPQESFTAVGMILDLIPEKFPHLYTTPEDEHLRQLKRKYVENSASLIAISERTRQDAIRYYGLDPKSIHTVHLAVDIATFQKKRDPVAARLTLAAKKITRPYFLQVGGRANHKNFTCVLEAFSRFAREEDMDLVCAGEDWEPQELASLERHGLVGRVHLYRRPSQAVLIDLYRQAKALIYPSIYEGFGIPPLEAMASGLPVVASQGGSIPEIVQKAALLFNPMDSASLEAALHCVLDPTVADELKKRGEERVSHFNWDRVADETLEVYRKTLGAKGVGAVSMDRGNLPLAAALPFNEIASVSALEPSADKSASS